MIRSNSTPNRDMLNKFCKLITLVAILYSSSVIASPPPLPTNNLLSKPAQTSNIIIPPTILAPPNENLLDNSSATNTSYPLQNNNSLLASPLIAPQKTVSQKGTTPADPALPTLPVDLKSLSSPALPVSIPVIVKTIVETPKDTDDEPIIIPVLPDENKLPEEKLLNEKSVLLPKDVLTTPAPITTIVITPIEDKVPVAAPLSQNNKSEPLLPALPTTMPVLKAAETPKDIGKDISDEPIIIPVLPDENKLPEEKLLNEKSVLLPKDVLTTPAPATTIVISPIEDKVPVAAPLSQNNKPEPSLPALPTTMPVLKVVEKPKDIGKDISDEPIIIPVLPDENKLPQEKLLNEKSVLLPKDVSITPAPATTIVITPIEDKVPNVPPKQPLIKSESIPVPVFVIPKVIIEATNIPTTPDIAPTKPSSTPALDVNNPSTTIAKTTMESAANLIDIDQFIKNETQMLLLPNDEIVLGILTDQARTDQMDFTNLAKIVVKSKKKDAQIVQQQTIENFIEDYAKKFNDIKKPSKIIINEAFDSIKKDNLFALRALVNNYPLLTKKADNNYTLLHATVEVGNYNLTKFLIIRGVNLAALNSDYQTALMMANTEDYINIGCLLKKAGSR